MRYIAAFTSLAAALYLFPGIYLPHYENGTAPTTVVVSDQEDVTSRKASSRSTHTRLMRLIRYERINGVDLRSPRRG